MSRTASGKFAPGTSGNPAGRPTDEANYRADGGWASSLTGLHTEGRDKRLSHAFKGTRMSHAQIAELWRKDGIAAKAIEAPTDEAMRESYELSFPNESKFEELKQDVEDRIEELKVNRAIELAWQYKRAYGGSAILLGTDDSAPLSAPLNISKAGSLQYLKVFEPIELVPAASYTDLGRAGEPSHFRINTIRQTAAVNTSIAPGAKERAALVTNKGGINTIIHESRLIIFQGIKTSNVWTSSNEVDPFWGDNIIDRFIDALRDCGVGYQGAGILATDASQPVITIEGLKEQIAKNPKKFHDRMHAIEMSRSWARAILLDAKGESYQRQTANLAGIPELLDRLSIWCSANVGVPLSVLLGYSPTSLGQPGEVELKLWHNIIRAMQTKDLTPPLKLIIKLIMRGMRERGLPKRFDINWRELERMNELQQSEARLNMARADEIYLKHGTLSPDEIRKSRWSNGYSFETQVDITEEAPGYVAALPPGVMLGKDGKAVPGGAKTAALGPQGAAPAAAGAHHVGGYARRDPVKRDYDGAGEHVIFAGMQICIENPRGSSRGWYDTDGTHGTTLMRYDYGYIVGSRGTDGDSLDVYLGPSPSAEWVYVVHQNSKATGFATYDEDKVMLGFDSPNHARDAYLRQYDDERFFGKMSVMSVEDFKLKMFASPGAAVTA